MKLCPLRTAFMYLLKCLLNSVLQILRILGYSFQEGNRHYTLLVLRFGKMRPALVSCQVK